MCFYRFAVIGFDSVRFGRFDFGKTVFAAPASLYCFAAMDCYLNFGLVLASVLAHRLLKDFAVFDYRRTQERMGLVLLFQIIHL